MGDELARLEREIQALLERPPLAERAQELARIERTLTDGYAHAQQIEAERWRLERRLGEVAAQLGRGRDEARTRELSAVAQRLASADGDLARLRGMLSRLHRRMDVRVA